MDIEFLMIQIILLIMDHIVIFFQQLLKYIEASRMTINAKVMACKSNFLSD